MRIGGDEFVIFLPDAANNAADRLVQRFQESLEKLNRDENRTFSVSASAGFAVMKGSRMVSIEDCIRASDREL